MEEDDEVDERKTVPLSKDMVGYLFQFLDFPEAVQLALVDKFYHKHGQLRLKELYQATPKVKLIDQAISIGREDIADGILEKNMLDPAKVDIKDLAKENVSEATLVYFFGKGLTLSDESRLEVLKNKQISLDFIKAIPLDVLQPIKGYDWNLTPLSQALNSGRFDIVKYFVDACGPLDLNGDLNGQFYHTGRSEILGVFEMNSFINKLSDDQLGLFVRDAIDALFGCDDKVIEKNTRFIFCRLLTGLTTRKMFRHDYKSYVFKLKVLIEMGFDYDKIKIHRDCAHERPIYGGPH